MMDSSADFGVLVQPIKVRETVSMARPWEYASAYVWLTRDVARHRMRRIRRKPTQPDSPTLANHGLRSVVM